MGYNKGKKWTGRQVRCVFCGREKRKRGLRVSKVSEMEILRRWLDGEE